jgi:hypothetical protein
VDGVTISGIPCGTLVVVLANRGARKMPLLTRARNRFTRSAPSEGTGHRQRPSDLDQMHHRSLIRNSSLERTIRLMCDPASPPNVLDCFWFPDTTLNTISCQSNAVMGQPISLRQFGVFSILFQSAPDGPFWSRPAVQQISVGLASKGMIEDVFRSARHLVPIHLPRKSIKLRSSACGYFPSP